MSLASCCSLGMGGTGAGSARPERHRGQWPAAPLARTRAHRWLLYLQGPLPRPALTGTLLKSQPGCLCCHGPPALGGSHARLRYDWGQHATLLSRAPSPSCQAARPCDSPVKADVCLPRDTHLCTTAPSTDRHKTPTGKLSPAFTLARAGLALPSGGQAPASTEQRLGRRGTVLTAGAGPCVHPGPR